MRGGMNGGRTGPGPVPGEGARGDCGVVGWRGPAPWPAHPNRGQLVVLQRRQVTAYEDVHLLEHAQELFRRDAELRREIVHSRLDHSILHQERTGAGDTMPSANARSRTPTAITGGFPNCAPIAAAPGPGTIGTPLPDASRTPFSMARGLASSATTTHR